MGGTPKTTDLLLSLVALASERREEEIKGVVGKIVGKHMECVKTIEMEDGERDELMGLIESDIQDILDVLKTVSLMKWKPSKIQSLVSGYGEVWSARILTAVMKCKYKGGEGGNVVYRYLDARGVLVVDEEVEGEQTVEWEESEERLREYSSPVPGCQVCIIATGFVARNTQGVSTTLGRDGSDYSASIFGKLLKANAIVIYTDVDGVLSADPRRVTGAKVLGEVSFNEAMELAYFGAKVIHPKTMQPAILSNPPIPIFIRNTFNPGFRGSRIFTSSLTHKERDRCVCGFASIDNMAVVNLEGSGMVGVKGVSRRLFGTLENSGINVVLIAQASSEHSITLAVDERDADEALEVLQEVFSRELKLKHISDITVHKPCSIIAAVGDGMSDTTGVAGRFFSALGESKINVLAIAQGCSERNISCVVRGAEATRALRAVHAAFRLSHQTVRVGVVMSSEGSLGCALLELLKNQRQKIMMAFDIDVQIIAVANDTRLLYTDNGGSITNEVWAGKEGGGSFREEKGQGIVKYLKSHVVCEDSGYNVIFDCTADADVSLCHPDWLTDGLHVITANNMGLSGDRDLRESIARKAYGRQRKGGRYLREVCVGGSLPVLRTIKDLLNSGDKIKKVDGIISVSFSYIMRRISPPPNDDGEEVEGCKLSEAVSEAINLGMMEKDFEKDLNNEYTARCLMVLVKELGMENEWDLERILSSSDQALKRRFGVNEDWETVKDRVDEEMRVKVEECRARKRVLRHVSTIDVGKGTVSIRFQEFPYGHVFAILPPGNACVRFFTQTHSTNPLVVQGQSEGLENTASALLAECLNLMQGIGVGFGTGGHTKLHRTSTSLALAGNIAASTEDLRTKAIKSFGGMMF